MRSAAVRDLQKNNDVELGRAVTLFTFLQVSSIKIRHTVDLGLMLKDVTLTEKMEKHGFLVIGYNTDGIFYSHPDGLDYHDENEGDDMGQWSTDHHFEKIRFKSAGAYEYVENGEYHAVVRGIPKKISKDFT